MFISWAMGLLFLGGGVGLVSSWLGDSGGMTLPSLAGGLAGFSWVGWSGLIVVVSGRGSQLC
jgi:hypothetical protein